MNVLDLFSGIGGFSLGLERAGMRTVAFCERDPYARAVLRKHWPDVPCFEDIHGIDADGLGRLGRIDLVCGGFPCQPFSVAGEQKGKDDDRHLWPEMCRVIALARPAWVIGENVTGLIPLALDDVLADLESLGYTARTFVVPAAAVGAPHRRDRLWIVASHPDRQQYEGSASAHQWPPAEELHPDTTTMQRRTIERDEPHGDVRSSEDVANTAGARLEAAGDVASAPGGTWTGQSHFRSAFDGGHWSIEPDVGRVAHGVPSRVDRLRCLGNAVVPQIPEIIGRAIMQSIC